MTDEHFKQYEFQLTQLIASDLSEEEFEVELKRLKKHFDLCDTSQ